MTGEKWLDEPAAFRRWLEEQVDRLGSKEKVGEVVGKDGKAVSRVLAQQNVRLDMADEWMIRLESHLSELWFYRDEVAA